MHPDSNLHPHAKLIETFVIYFTLVVNTSLLVIYTNILKGVGKAGTVPRGALPKKF